MLLFNDVTMEGFRVNADLCGIAKMSLILDKIAKYHALSMIILEEKGSMQFPNPYASPTMKEMMAPMKFYIQSLGSVVKTWPEFMEIGERLEDPEMGDKILEDMLKTLSTERSVGFNVLNHGDFHIRNLMFRMTDDDEDEEEEVLFLDFQIPILNSPAFDLNGMLHGICNLEARERKEEVLYMYHTKLVNNLKAYGYEGEIPSAIDVQVEMLRASPLEVYQSLCTLQLQMLPNLKIGDLMTHGAETKEALARLYNDPSFVNHLQKLLRSLNHRGMFN